LGEKQKEIIRLEAELQKKKVWEDYELSGKISGQLEELKNEVLIWEEIKSNIQGLEGLLKGGELEEDDLEFVQEQYEDLRGQIDKIEMELKFSGPYDRGGAIVTFQAGAGGTDAQDWTEMLLRVYLKYAEKQGWEAKILEKVDGAEAGIKNATIKMTGKLVYGRMKSESGVHRLVRLSPFNADNLRQTSFAMVEVLPIIDNLKNKIEIKQDDLRVDTFRSSGAGGQSVNTTDSAVRVTHLPTGLVATCQNERSQLRNKEQALSILQGRLIKLMEEERVREIDELRGERKAVEWGSQIRSYVLHPYKMVKDHRTNKQTTAVEKVLDGEVGLIKN